MITNILLGLILGVVITSFIILNIKINRIDDYVKRTFTNTNVIDTSVDNHYKLTNILLDRFNEKVLNDNEHCEIIKDLIEKNNIEIYNNQQILYNIPVKVETFVAEENNSIRKEIKKLAKISSKINPKQTQSKSTQK